MKPGPKALPPSDKFGRGTLKPSRDGGKQEVIVAGDPPIQPDYLTPEAVAVWQEEVGRVMAAGVVEIDSSLCGRYCSLEALIRKAFAAGEPPPAAYLAEARRMGELMGIAGRKSRIGKVADDPSKSANPFQRVGSRAR
jgi:phage terminase small subunit